MMQAPMTKESQALLSSLAAQRNHVLGILEGLSELDLRRLILPSRWACAGLVHHLAIDVERFWFRAVVAGEQLPDDEPDNAWQVPADLDGHRGAGRIPAGDSTCRRHHCRRFPRQPTGMVARGPVRQLAARQPARDPAACDR